MSRQASDKLLNQAYTAHQEGRAEEAERLYKRLLRKSAGDTDALNLLGLLYLQMGRFNDAKHQIRRALARAPNNAQSHYNLGASLTGLGEVGDAIDSFRRSLELDPTQQATRHALSAALNDAGAASEDTEEALHFYKESLQLDSRNAKAAINLGNLCEQLGDFEEAEAMFQKAISIAPNFAEAHFQLAHLKSHESTQYEIEAMQDIYSDAEKDDRATLAFGLAKAFEKLERFDEEFEWLGKAHELKLSSEPYDEDSRHKGMAGIAKEFGSGAFDNLDPSRGSDLVFVLGMPRSGTSLTEQILASHPEIHGAGELMSVADLAISAKTSDSELAAMSELAAGKIAGNSCGKAICVETTPTNFLHLGKIGRLFPAAKIVHCVRDPLDTCVSIYQHPLSIAHAYSHSLDTLGRYYRQYQKLMLHWQQVLPNPMLDVEYATLATDFEATVRKLVEFCGVRFDERCLSFHETRRRVATPSAGQVRQPIYTSSIGRWRRYEKYLSSLTEALSKD